MYQGAGLREGDGLLGAHSGTFGVSQRVSTKMEQRGRVKGLDVPK